VLWHCTFFLWWIKPLDVEEGIVLQGENLDLLAAFLAAANRFPNARLLDDNPRLNSNPMSISNPSRHNEFLLSDMTLECFSEFDMLAYQSRRDIGHA
jgi:hypothetical protein